MSRPVLRAEGVIFSEDYEMVLVQFDNDESFYRFPGGSIEWNESGSEAISRELLEEFELQVRVNHLFVISEAIIEYEGSQHHQCTLLHVCKPYDGQEINELTHKEITDVKLAWKSVQELAQRPVYPEGILDIIISKDFNRIHHLITRNIY